MPFNMYINSFFPPEDIKTHILSSSKSQQSKTEISMKYNPIKPKQVELSLMPPVDKGCTEIILIFLEELLC